jgi:hypothetical protein
MKRQTAVVIRAFLDGCTAAGLFRKLDYPGAPKEFIDSRPIEEILAGGEFEEYIRDAERVSGKPVPRRRGSTKQ